MQNIRSLCTNSNPGKRRAIQYLTSQWAATTVPKYLQLVGSFLLSQLQNPNINIGLYKDDGLATSNTTPRDTENITKEICHIFSHNGLRITIEANKQTINSLDVTFNLNKSTYQPFTKLNTTLQYAHRERNHPPNTTLHYEPPTTNKRKNRQRNNVLRYNPPFSKNVITNTRQDSLP